jgi:hypothetical protein
MSPSSCPCLSLRHGFLWPLSLQPDPHVEPPSDLHPLLPAGGHSQWSPVVRVEVDLLRHPRVLLPIAGPCLGDAHRPVPRLDLILGEEVRRSHESAPQTFSCHMGPFHSPAVGHVRYPLHRIRHSEFLCLDGVPPAAPHRSSKSTLSNPSPGVLLAGMPLHRIQ